MITLISGSCHIQFTYPLDLILLSPFNPSQHLFLILWYPCSTVHIILITNHRLFLSLVTRQQPRFIHSFDPDAGQINISDNLPVTTLIVHHPWFSHFTHVPGFKTHHSSPGLHSQVWTGYSVLIGSISFPCCHFYGSVWSAISELICKTLCIIIWCGIHIVQKYTPKCR